MNYKKHELSGVKMPKPPKDYTPILFGAAFIVSIALVAAVIEEVPWLEDFASTELGGFVVIFGGFVIVLLLLLGLTIILPTLFHYLRKLRWGKIVLSIFISVTSGVLTSITLWKLGVPPGSNLIVFSVMSGAAVLTITAL